LLILNLRNGMSLINLSGHIQTGVVGLLLILSVLVPNVGHFVRESWRRQRLKRGAVAVPSLAESMQGRE
jgi:rhamnose transport system permease protein